MVRAIFTHIKLVEPVLACTIAIADIKWIKLGMGKFVGLYVFYGCLNVGLFNLHTFHLIWGNLFKVFRI